MLWGLVTELVLEEVEGPTGLLAASERLAYEHAIPVGFLIDRIAGRLRLAAADEPEFALLEVDGSCAWLRLPSAGIARRGDHHRLAGRTLMQLRCLATVALNLRRVDCAPVDGERPLDMILGQAVAIDGTAVIENDRGGLAISRPQHSADHLAVKSHLLGGPRQNAATHGGHVPAFGEHHAIGDDLGLAGRESIQDGLALANRCCSVQVLGADAGLCELVADMDRVLDTDSEAHS